MGRFLQVAAGVLLAVVLGISLSKQNKDITLALSLAVCCMVLLVMVEYLEPVMDFLRELQQLGQLDSEMLQILFKAVGIGLVAEIAGLICADSGNAALGNGLQILGAAVVLWLSLPLMRSLLELVQKIMGEV